MARLIPKLTLSGENQSKRVLGIHPVIQKKPDLLQHLFIQQMRFVYDHNQFSVVKTSEQFDLPEKLVFGIRSFVSLFTPHLLQEDIVETRGSEL